MKRLFVLFFFLLAFSFANAQDFKGRVFLINADGQKEPAGFATIVCIENGQVAEADIDGNFTFKRVKLDKATFYATFIGYTKDTVAVNIPHEYHEFNLKDENELGALVVTGRQEANFLSKTTPVRTEVITAAGLCKMACCNLAESFENSASVSVGYSDAVSGAKQIKLLGLSGTYVQMLDENKPIMRGLSSPFGLTYIPGQWLESIQIAKGPSSVINGLEGLTGLINMEHRKPTAENPLFVNLFTNQELKLEANVASSLQLNEKWSTVIMAHASGDTKEHDGNDDGFKDEPKTLQLNFDNRWLYQAAPGGVQIRFGVKAFSDKRIGGQMGYKEGMNDHGVYEAVSKGIWGSEIHNSGIDGNFKLGIPLSNEGAESLAFVATYSYYDMNTSYGTKYYKGYQNMAFVNAMYQNQIHENHHYTFGIAGQFDNIHESYMDLSFEKGTNKVIEKNTNTGSPLDGMDDKMFGVYGEYTFTNEKFTAVLGARGDYHSDGGWVFGPRANLKYSFTDNTIVRLTGGRGFRHANIIADNLGLMSSSRDIYIEEKINMEDAWTFGGNFTQYFKIGECENSFVSFDYFRSSFNDQLVVDWDKYSKNNLVAVYNCHGRSFTDTYQFDLSVEPFKRFTAILTYRYTNAKIEMDGQGLVNRPLMSKYKGVLNLQYATNLNKWTFDVTAQLNGPAPLPLFMGGGESEVYPMFFAQVTKKFRGVDVYVGVENIGNYMQENPIISANDPYSDDFNASMVWGPLMGRKFYAGM
ncbi:MAG: carboxypeptidase-like regulatory domain-containing protein, partial [Bacteroidales bacterium]|nr:carboxypeptidase-like regulatory domain-containing protein [Bacteroidales bacterium]